MAERQFMLVIRNETDNQAGNKVGGAGGINAGSSSGSKSPSTKTGDGKKTAVDYLAKQITGMFTVAKAVSVADTIVSHNLSLIEVRTGSRELQERTTYKYNTAKSFITSAGFGAIAGSAYGPAGAAVGALFGLISSGISYATNRALQEKTIDENRRVEDMQKLTTTQRVTVSGSRYMNAGQM